MKQSLLFFAAGRGRVGPGPGPHADASRSVTRTTTAALTQSEYGGHPGNFRSLDVNGDGVLSHDEFVRRHGSASPPHGARTGRVPGLDRNSTASFAR